MLVACIGLYGERVEQALVGIKRLMPYVIRYVVIADETVTEEQQTLLKNEGCEVYCHPWEDSMVKMRNQYLDKVQTDDWVIVHDPDEWFCDKFCEDVQQLVEQAEKEGITVLLINSHDTTILEDGSKDSSISDFFKNLVFQKLRGTKYVGVGEVKEVHETLIMPGTPKAVRLPKDKYFYDHIKYWHEVWERAARNVFMAGGGNNVGETNIAWKPLRLICDALGLDNWTKAREYFRQGNIDSNLWDWLWQNRYEGFDYHHEMMEMGRWYFEYLHPEEKENKDGRVWDPVHELVFGTPPEVMRFVEETYMELLGRHADQEGKIAYTQAIIAGALQREDLQALLKQSPEYQQRTGIMGEDVRIRVPIQAQINLTEDLFLEAMMKSKTYWEGIKPKIDIGKFIQESLDAENWDTFVNWFYTAEERTIEQFLFVLSKLLSNEPWP